MQRAFLSALETFNLPPKSPIAVAVSGGGDSVALLHLLHNYTDFELHVLHYDHALRPESTEDAAFVAQLAKSLNLPCATHRRTEKLPEGNLQQSARNARIIWLLNTCEARGCAALMLGHTQDDTLENMFMRLGRGSGLAGLVGLKAQSYRGENATPILRPLLGISRSQLRTFLTENSKQWREDASNENRAFHRIRVRQFLEETLNDGEKEGILGAFANLSRANDALNDTADAFYEQNVEKAEISIKLPWANLQKKHLETQLRVCGKIHQHFFPHDMPPRLSKREYLLKNLEKMKKLPLGGLMWQLKSLPENTTAEGAGTQLVVTREGA